MGTKLVKFPFKIIFGDGIMSLTKNLVITATCFVSFLTQNSVAFAALEPWTTPTIISEIRSLPDENIIYIFVDGTTWVDPINDGGATCSSRNTLIMHTTDKTFKPSLAVLLTAFSAHKRVKFQSLHCEKEFLDVSDRFNITNISN